MAARPGDALGSVELEEEVELLVEELVVVGEVVAEQRERFGVGAASRGDLGPAGGDEIDGGEVLEDLDRIGGGQHGDGAGEPDALGGLGDRGEQVEAGLIGEPRQVDELPQAHRRIGRPAGSAVISPKVKIPISKPRALSPVMWTPARG